MFAQIYRTDIYPLPSSYEMDPDWTIFWDIAHRAQTIIAQYDKTTIHQHAETVRNHLFNVDYLSTSTENKFIDEIPDANIRGILNLSYAYRIKHGYRFFQSKRYPINHTDLYFALIALYEIDRAMMVDLTMQSGRYIYPNYNKRDNFHHCAHHALEAVIYAENAITLSDEVDNQVKEKTSERARQAAYKRHEKTRDFCNRFIQIYCGGVFKSKASAAREFIEMHDKDEIPLAPTNAERTLLDALRKHEKSLDKFK